MFEDLLGMKRRDQTSYPCYRWLLIMTAMNKPKIVSSCTLEQTLRILEMHNPNDSEAKKTFKDLAILPIVPICFKIPIAMVHQTTEMNNTFCGKPMNNLLHGVLPINKKCTTNLLRVETRWIPNVKTMLREDHNFKSERKTVSNTFNKLFEKAERNAIDNQLSVDFS